MPASVWKGPYAVVMTVAALGISLGTGHSFGRDNGVERYATRRGNVIQVHPSEVAFQVPESWRRYTMFFLTAREVRKAALSGKEIVNATLNWRDCASQIGGDNQRWLRVYVVDGTEEEILKRIQEKGLAAAAKMPNHVPSDGHVTVWGSSPDAFKMTPTREGPWEHVDILYSLFFGDYGGDGYVSFYLRPVAGRVLVLAVGYFATGAAPPDERENLLKSVIIPDSLTPADSH